jgi:kinesin family member 12
MGRSLSYIFSKIPSKSSSSFLVRASYLEIYNETLRDLLNPRSGQPLNLRQNANGSFHVENSVSVVCSDESDLHSVLREGVSNRQVRAHALNQESSRSHAILIVEIEDLVAGTKGKICFCDLAGSEALKHSKSAGDALKETAHINKSLFNLGAVISSCTASRLTAH